MMRFGLTDSTIEKISNVLAQYPQIEKAILYGSRAKGNYKHGSDIDLTLLGDSNLTLRVLYNIMDKLEELLLPYTIDLSIFANINDADVRAHIERVGVVFYERRLVVTAE
jgi:predicted nucleotidyltransferase